MPASQPTYKDFQSNYIATLKDQRKKAVKVLEDLDQKREVVRRQITSIDEQLIEAGEHPEGAIVGPYIPESLPQTSERKPHGTLLVAAQQVYQHLLANKGRKFSAKELNPLAQGQKIRAIVYKWNTIAGLTPHSKVTVQGSRGKPIKYEGEYRDRVYWLE